MRHAHPATNRKPAPPRRTAAARRCEVPREAAGSRAFAEIGYNAAHRVVEILFHPRAGGGAARAWRYYNISRQRWTAWRRAESRGGYYCRRVRNRHDFRPEPVALPV